MKRQALWWVIVVVVLSIIMAVWTSASRRDEREMNGVLAAFDAALHQGDADEVLGLSTPSALDQLSRMISAASSDTEDRLRSRPLHEIDTVLSLRANYTARQLSTLKPEDEVRRMFSGGVKGPLTPSFVRAVVVTGERATASVFFVSDGKEQFMGTGEFFERIGGRWKLNWMNLQDAALDQMMSDMRQSPDVLAEQMRKVLHPGVDVGALWKGPRE